MIEVVQGNIFDSKAQTIVNTINCNGAMGKGIAKQFKAIYPDMYKEYKVLCQHGKIRPGILWIYKTPDKWILNFPTKDLFQFKSKIEYLELGLQKFLDTYKAKGITSIAFPLLGASNGGLNPSVVKTIMFGYLNQCNIPITIYDNG